MSTRLLLAAALVSVTACSDSSGDDWQPLTPANDVVVTSFEPARLLASRLMGGVHPVTCPLPADADPAGWRPARDDIASMQTASLIVVAGADFEQWVGTTSLPSNRVVKLAEGLSDELIEYESVTHTHGAGGEHTHDGVDGHTWLDPVGLIEQGDHLLEAYVRVWPEHEAAFVANAKALRSDLEAIDAEYAALAEDMRAAWILCSHPAYNYLARRYGWKPNNFDFDPDVALTQAQLDEIAASVAAGRTTLMLWESAPLAETVAALDALGVRSVLVSPGERPSPDSDLLSTLRDNATRLREALAP